MKFKRTLFVAGSAMLAAMITTGAAFGAAQSVTNPVKLSGQTTVTLFDLTSGVCDPCVPDFLFDDPNVVDENFGVQAGIKATATMKWTANNTVKTSYDDSLVKQGSTLNTSDEFTTGAGIINASMTLAAFLLLVEDPTGADFTGASTDWYMTGCGMSVYSQLSILVTCIHFHALLYDS